MTTGIAGSTEPEPSHDPVAALLARMTEQLDRIEQRLQQITEQLTAPSETDTDQENSS